MKRQYWIITVYIVFLVSGIPWYWPDNTTYLVLGLPVWFFVAILVSTFASLFTAFILLRYSWDTEIKPDE